MFCSLVPITNQSLLWHRLLKALWWHINHLTLTTFIMNTNNTLPFFTTFVRNTNILYLAIHHLRLQNTVT